MAEKALPLSVLSTIRDWVLSLIPSSLSDLSDDATHRTVTDAQITAWNAASGGLTIDDYLDADSSNPVQNSALYSEFASFAYWAKPKICLARGTATSATSGTSVTQIQLTSKFLDTSADNPFYSIASGGIKVLVDGYYRISGSAYITPASGTTTLGTYIRTGTAFSSATEINGVLQYMGATGARAVQVIPRVVHLNENEIIFLASRCRGTAGTVDASHATTFLQVEYIPYDEYNWS